MMIHQFSSYSTRMVLLYFLCVVNVVTAFKMPTATLSCNGTGLSLSFNKTELDGAGSNYTISFNGSTDSNCQITGETSSNIQGDRIWIQANYDQCGIKVSEDNTTIVYNQIVVLNFQEAPNHPLIYRGKRDEYHIRCQKTRSFTQSASVFNVTKDAGSTINKVGNSTFKITLVRFTTPSFTTPDTTGTLELGQKFYFQLSLQTPRSDIGMYPQQCYATKNDGTGKYFLIKDRCVNLEDGTVKILTATSDKAKFQWENEAFRYFGQSNEIYIYCDVLICIGSSTTDCQRCSTSKRKRRELSDDLNGNIDENDTTKEVGISSELIVLIDDRKAEKPNNNNGNNNSKKWNSFFSGTNGIIAIVIIALFVVIVTVAVMKKVFFTAATKTVCSTAVTFEGVEY